MFEVKCPGYFASIAKSTGFMVALMSGTGLPLLKYPRGSRAYYTVGSLGPRPGLETIFDWHAPSPVFFNEREVEKAIFSGLVARVGDEIHLTPSGVALSQACSNIWSPYIDDHFDVRKGWTDWRTWKTL
jgi:hypothetical protein